MPETELLLLLLVLLAELCKSPWFCFERVPVPDLGWIRNLILEVLHPSLNAIG